MSLELPKVISPNGQELWEWAGKLSQHIHLLDEARRLRLHLRKSGTECGDCQLWMTRDCPREQSSMTGYNRGPSMGAPICSKFMMSNRALVLQQKWETELMEIDKQLVGKHP